MEHETNFISLGPGPEVIFFYFPLLIKTKIQTNKEVSFYTSLSGVIFIKLVNVKTPTIVFNIYELDKFRAQLS